MQTEKFETVILTNTEIENDDLRVQDNQQFDFDRSDEIVSPGSLRQSIEGSPVREDISDDTSHEEEFPATEISPMKRIQDSSKRSQVKN